MINDFINDVCDILDIEPPEISFDTSHFSSETMMAQCSPDGSTIYIKNMTSQIRISSLQSPTSSGTFGS